MQQSRRRRRRLRGWEGLGVQPAPGPELRQGAVSRRCTASRYGVNALNQGAASRRCVKALHCVKVLRRRTESRRRVNALRQGAAATRRLGCVTRSSNAIIVKRAGSSTSQVARNQGTATVSSLEGAAATRRALQFYSTTTVTDPRGGWPRARGWVSESGRGGGTGSAIIIIISGEAPPRRTRQLRVEDSEAADRHVLGT